MLNLKSAGLAAAGVLVGVLAAVAAGAQVPKDDPDAPKLTVQYRPSQLESDEGVRRLYARLLNAAERVCPPSTGTLLNPAIAACRRHAVEGAVAQIHSTRLATLSAKSPKAG